MRPSLYVVAAAILIASALLRIYASLGDFWLDEIWSANIAARVGSFVRIFTSIHQENNHYLNTALMWLMGPQAPWTMYRAPAVAAGVGTVALSGLIARGSATESWMAMLVTGTADLLVHYSSEARGYAYVVFFAAAGFWALDRSFQRRAAAHEYMFAVACVLGFLSQAMFGYFFTAAACWAFWRWWCLRPSAVEWVRHLTRAFLLPVLAVGALWIVDLRQTENAGGPIYPLSDVAIETASRAVGGPPAGVAAGGIAVLVALTFGTVLVTRERSADDRWLFFLLVCVVVPGALVAALGRHELYVRYFLIAVFFLLIALSSFLAHLFDTGGTSRLLAIAAITAMLAGNAVQLTALLRYGRGEYVAALTSISSRTAGSEIVIGSDHDFRNSMVIDFYRTRIAGLKPLRYVDQQHWPADGPEWLLRHDLSPTFDAPPRIGLPGKSYQLVDVFPYAGLSGWSWAVYHRQN